VDERIVRERVVARLEYLLRRSSQSARSRTIASIERSAI
jgi:hypothetical protein